LTAYRRAVYYAAVSPSELAKEIETGKFRSVYYFYGSEDYRIKEAQKAIIARFLPKAQQTTNHTTLSAARQKLDDILTELSMIPMLGERQVYTIEEIQSLSQAQIEKILSLLTPPDPTRVVVFTSPSARTPRKKSKMAVFLAAKTAAIEFSELPEEKVRHRITTMLGEKKIKIEPEALEILVKLSGGDLGGLIGETNKLIDYIGEGGNIKKDDVLAVSSSYQSYQVWDLGNRLAVGDLEKGLGIIEVLLGEGEKPSGIIFNLSDHFIKLYLTKNEKRYSQSDKQAWKFKNQVDRLGNDQLERIIRLIADADFDLRNNVRPERLVLERLAYYICSEQRKKADG